jgi:hypothetical protein
LDRLTLGGRPEAGVLGSLPGEARGVVGDGGEGGALPSAAAALVTAFNLRFNAVPATNARITTINIQYIIWG